MASALHIRSMRFPCLAALPLVARAIQAQAPVRVTGVVFDSLARAPLAGAEVQLVRADARDSPVRSATTDRLGQYHVDSVPPGPYLAAFIHPVLDSLGVTLNPVRVDVQAGDAARLALAIPSASTLRRELCGGGPAAETTGLLVGWVRDAATVRPRGQAAVQIAWSEVLFRDGGPSVETRAVTVSTRDDGWFAACGVPAGTELRLRGVSGEDSSGVVPLQLTGGAVMRRDLMVGSGRARLTGVARTEGGRPIAGARVWLVGGTDTTTTNDVGAFTLSAAGMGSHVLAARAVGYVPASVPVEVRPGVSDAVVVALVSLSAYLDTVKTIRERAYAVDHGGFEARRRAAGSGHFIDRQQIDRLGTPRTMSLLRTLPGVTGVASRSGEAVLMHGRNGAVCSPAVFIDGVQLSGPATAWMLDASAPADRITGIEVYASATTAPAQYQRVPCGSIVIWTENARDPNAKR